MPKLREIITELPEKVAYDYGRIEAAASFGDTLKEVVAQTERTLGTRVSCETIADIIANEFDPESMPDKHTVLKWLGGTHKPATAEDAKAVARALRLPEDYLTRFYM